MQVVVPVSQCKVTHNFLYAQKQRQKFASPAQFFFIGKALTRTHIVLGDLFPAAHWGRARFVRFLVKILVRKADKFGGFQLGFVILQRRKKYM